MGMNLECQHNHPLNGRGKSEASGGQHLTVEGGTTFGGGAMSFCARVKYDAMQFYSRIFDFGKGEENDNIYLCNNRDSQDLKFSVRRGSDSHDVKIRNFFQPNELQGNNRDHQRRAADH